MAELRDANSNPWYVLMTLYGEQDHVDPKVNQKRAEENCAVWNAWSCQGLDEDAAAEVAKLAHVDVAETRGWTEMAAKVKRQHRAAMKKRSKDVADYAYPGFPVFKDDINCSEIQFFNKVVLKNCIFTQDADFDTATFTQGAYFSSATFTQTANFSSATFTQTADFDSATFTQAANFYSATFDGPAKFVGAKFGVRGADKVCVPIFTEAAFARLASFRDAEFVTHYPVLEGTEFREALVVAAKPANWPATDLVLLDKAAEDAKNVPIKEMAKESCAKIRHALAKQGLPEDEHFFFRREMGFAAQIGGFWQRLPYRLFGVFSEYGQSIARPSLWLLGLWLVPALILLSYFAWVGSFGDSVWRGIDAVGLSFANIFTVFGFHRLYFEPEQIRELPALLQVIGAAQTVLALPLLFFLGLALRKRFRLR